MALLNYPTIWNVTKNRAIQIEMGVLHQLDQCQIFSRGHNLIDKTFKYCKMNKNRHCLIIHRFGRVTTYWLFFQKAPLFIFIWLLKWSCLGHNMMNQAKYPEYQVGQVDIAVEQCDCGINSSPEDTLLDQKYVAKIYKFICLLGI